MTATQCPRHTLRSLYHSSPFTPRLATPLSLQKLPHQPSYRPFTTTPSPSAVAPPRASSRPLPPNSKLASRDRGPASSESTQTDFAAMNVLGNTANPSTSVDICITDGFQLDSGLRIGDGDGVILTQSEAFVWRPWMAAGAGAGGEAEATGVVHGSGLRQKGVNEIARTGGVVNKLGQFEIRDEAWGLFKALWPKPGMFLSPTFTSTEAQPSKHY